jgi:hypothetical protein
LFEQQATEEADLSIVRCYTSRSSIPPVSRAPILAFPDKTEFAAAAANHRGRSCVCNNKILFAGERFTAVVRTGMVDAREQYSWSSYGTIGDGFGESARRRFPKQCSAPKSGAARIELGSGS